MISAFFVFIARNRDAHSSLCMQVTRNDFCILGGLRWGSLVASFSCGIREPASRYAALTPPTKGYSDDKGDRRGLFDGPLQVYRFASLSLRLCLPVEQSYHGCYRLQRRRCKCLTAVIPP